MKTTWRLMITMTIRYIGLDPGTKGSIAAVDNYDNVLFIHDLSASLDTYWYLLTILADDVGSYEATYVAVEDVCGRPGQSCASNTTFMKLAGYAELLGFSLATGGNFIKVRPQIWKKHFGLITKDLTKTERKHLSIDLAKRLFPSVEDQLTASKDGRAEALLIAKYCKDTCNNA